MIKIKTTSELAEYTREFSNTFTSVDFSDCQLDDISFVKGSTFFACVFNNGDFTASDFSECSFIRCTAIEANFTAATFAGSKIEYCKMKKSIFNYCDFSGVDFSRTDMEHAKMKEATLKNVKLKELELFGADISGCDLRYADVEKASLIGTKFNLTKITSDQKKLILKMKYKSVEQNISLFIVDDGVDVSTDT